MEKADFLIPVNGLASGKTFYRWTAGREFFEEFENSDILDAALSVDAEVDKSGNYIGVDFHISGDLTVECDRCLGDLSIPVDSVGKLSVKFGDEEEYGYSADEDGRETVFIPRTDTDLDLRQIIYDYACLALPMMKVHAEGECDPEVTGRLGIRQDQPEPEDAGNPFSALKDIFKS